jgi:hypothetical protein
VLTQVIKARGKIQAAVWGGAYLKNITKAPSIEASRYPSRLLPPLELLQGARKNKPK